MSGVSVFLSWSGARSKTVAQALYEWLPQVLQLVHPWISVEIEKGARWDGAIASRLDETKIGILCLTPENLLASWLLFEAGAISKTKGAHACTYLFDLTPADIPAGPLALFQHTLANDKEDTGRLVATINNELGNDRMTEVVLNRSFEKWWPDLQEQLSKIPPPSQPKPQRKDREILEEILEIVRLQQRSATLSENESSFIIDRNYYTKVNLAILYYLRTSYPNAEVLWNIQHPGSQYDDADFVIYGSDNSEIWGEWAYTITFQQSLLKLKKALEDATYALSHKTCSGYLMLLVCPNQRLAHSVRLKYNSAFSVVPEGFTVQIGYLSEGTEPTSYLTVEER